MCRRRLIDETFLHGDARRSAAAFLPSRRLRGILGVRRVHVKELKRARWIEPRAPQTHARTRRLRVPRRKRGDNVTQGRNANSNSTFTLHFERRGDKMQETQSKQQQKIRGEGEEETSGTDIRR